MSDPRITGLLLMATAIVTFLGTTSNTLPPVTFSPASLQPRLQYQGRTKKNPEHLKGIPGHPWEGEFGFLYKGSGTDPAFVARKTSKPEK